MPTARCHCGAVAVTIPQVPETLTIGAAPGATTSDAWGVETWRFMRCVTRGCVTLREPLGEPLAGRDGPRMGLEARPFEPVQLAEVRVRRPDGAVTEAVLD